MTMTMPLEGDGEGGFGTGGPDEVDVLVRLQRIHAASSPQLPRQRRPVDGRRGLLGGLAYLCVPLLVGALRGGSLLLATSLRREPFPLRRLLGDPSLLVGGLLYLLCSGLCR